MGNPIIIKIIIIIMLSCHVDVIPKSSAVESSLFLLDCCKSVTLEINGLPAGVMSDWPGIYVLSWGSEKKFPMKYIQKPDRGHSSLHRKLSDGIWTFGGGIKSVPPVQPTSSSGNMMMIMAILMALVTSRSSAFSVSPH